MLFDLVCNYISFFEQRVRVCAWWLEFINFLSINIPNFAALCLRL